MAIRPFGAIFAIAVFAPFIPTASGEDWVREGPIGSGDDAYCVTVSPEGLGVRLTHDKNSYGLAFFALPSSAITFSKTLVAGEYPITTVMAVDPGYLALRRGTVVISADTRSATIYATSGDFHLYEALKSGSTFSIKAGDELPPSLSLDEVPGTLMTYSLGGSSKALAWVENCISTAGK